MPSLDLFDERSELEIRDALDAASTMPPAFDRELFALSVDYLEGRQLDDVESELSDRYERTQTGGRGGQIAPQTMPLTERYVAEAANAYNRSVTRALVDADGNVDERSTDELRRMLDACSYDETMHRNDQYAVLLKTSLVWYQARAGALRPMLVWPHDVWPIAAQDDWTDVADQADYAAHVVQLAQDAGSTIDKQNRYVWLEPAQTAFYRGATPYKPDAGGMTRYPSAYLWPQAVDGLTPLDGSEQLLPLQMLTYWHYRKPVGELIIDNDPAIAVANRELNLQLSILLDTLAHQGWATMLLSLLNPDSAPTTFSAGPRNGISIQAGESASMLSSPVNYTDLVGVLSEWTRLLAIAMRQSPNDFSTQAQGAQSGFAKLVDSLPKLEQREERLARLKATEARVAWPRLAAIGSAIGQFTAPVEQLAKLTLRTEFSPIEFPQTVQERAVSEDHDIRHGLTTPARILAKRRGIPIADAVAEVNENLGIDPESSADAAGTQAGDDVQKTALNGAQTASMVNIVSAIAARQIPRNAGVSMLQTSFRVSREEAEQIVGDAGSTFFAADDKPAPAAAPAAASEPEPMQPRASAMSALGSLITRGRR